MTKFYKLLFIWYAVAMVAGVGTIYWVRTNALAREEAQTQQQQVAPPVVEPTIR